MEKAVGITEARKEFSRIVDEVRTRRRSYLILKNGEPAAAVVPVSVYERYERERQEMFDLIRSVQARNVDADPDEIMREVLEAQQAVRREHGE